MKSDSKPHRPAGGDRIAEFRYPARATWSISGSVTGAATARPVPVNAVASSVASSAATVVNVAAGDAVIALSEALVTNGHLVGRESRRWPVNERPGCARIGNRGLVGL